MLCVALLLVGPVVGVGSAGAGAPFAATFHGLNPARVLDTRVGGSTVDGVGQGGGPVGALSVTSVLLAGRGGVPGAGVGAVALNVTAVGPSADGYVTVWPSGATRPTASNLNLRVGVTVPNMVIVPLGGDGKVSIFNDSGTTNLLVDVLGWFPVTAQVSSPNPARVSVGPAGVQGNDYSSGAAVSADGRYVAFISGSWVRTRARPN